MQDKSLSELLRNYVEIEEELKRRRVIRTSKIVADVGETIAAEKLNLTLEESAVAPNYDAKDAQGQTYQIKTRRAPSMSKKPGIFPIEPEKLKGVDFVVYVGLDYYMQLQDLLKIPSGEVRVNAHNRVNINNELRRQYRVSI